MRYQVHWNGVGYAVHDTHPAVNWNLYVFDTQEQAEEKASELNAERQDEPPTTVETSAQ